MAVFGHPARMQKTTPIFPGFHTATLSRPRRSAQQILADKLAEQRRKSPNQLGAFFKRLIPDRLLDSEQQKAHSRNRIFSKRNTFWGFFSQVLSSDGSCSAVVKKLQAYAALRAGRTVSSSTAAYCRARAKLSEKTLQEVFCHTVKGVQSTQKGKDPQPRVIVVDGTGFSMPDTELNQQEWPQMSGQKPGCGFPSARLLGLFSLETGALLSFAIGNKKSHELPLLRQQYDVFSEGDIMLGDKAFCNYFDQASLLNRGVQSVVTLRRRKPVAAAQCIKKQGDGDLIISWKRPKWTGRYAYSEDEWKQLPETLTLRQIKVTVAHAGFRVKSFYIITTLTDPIEYPAADLAELYYRRWEVELHFRHLKTTMGMDELRCKSPAMIRKELLMNFIVYNAIRWLICDAAHKQNGDPQRISFKGAIQALQGWEPLLEYSNASRKKRLEQMDSLHVAIAAHTVAHRPGRREPRCLKRRKKNYDLMTRPRGEMQEIPHRSSYRAKSP